MSKTIVETVYLYDKWGHPVFQIDIEDPGEYKETSFNAIVHEVISWTGDGDNTPYEKEHYLNCYIRWDSCSHFWFGELDKDGSPDGYLHICGGNYFRRHCELLNFLYDLAFKRMDREVWDDNDTWPLKLQELYVNPPIIQSEKELE